MRVIGCANIIPLLLISLPNPLSNNLTSELISDNCSKDISIPAAPKNLPLIIIGSEKVIVVTCFPSNSYTSGSDINSLHNLYYDHILKCKPNIVSFKVLIKTQFVL